MVHAARALGLGVMLGCMVESGLGIAPGAHIASLMDHVDLDGNLLLADDPWPGVAFVDGVQLPVGRRRGSALRPRRLLHPRRGPLGRPALRQDRARRACATGPRTSSRSSTRVEPARSRTASRSSAPSTRRCRYEPTTALVGVATQGGRFPPAWRELLEGLRSAPGSTSRTACTSSSRPTPELTALAREHGVELRDLRKPPPGLNVPTGANLTHGATSILTVGSDCAIGKMTVALELDREARRRGLKSEFVPTGQTGIAIAGWGISVDAVVSDFIAGAAEQLVLEGRRARRRGALRRGAGLAAAPRRTPASPSG